MKIADYLLANLDTQEKMTSIELADKLNVGQATIIRFSKKLGYKSFKNMLIDVINSDVSEHDNEIQLTDSTYATLEKIKDNYISSVKIAFEVNQPQLYDETTNLLNQTDSIVCFGYQATGGFAFYLSQSLIELGKSAFYSSSIIETKQRMLFLDPKKDVVILISKSGETDEIIELAKFAKSLNLKIICITNIGQTSLSSLSDFVLSFLYDSLKTRLKTYTQNSGLMFVIDSLILALYKKDYSRYINRSGEYKAFSKPTRYKK